MLARYFRFLAVLLLLFAGAANARDFLDWRSNEIATVAAAALPARLLAAQPGERVLDLCAAPGGKTLQLAAVGARSAPLCARTRVGSRPHGLDLARLLGLHAVRLAARLGDQA